MDGNGGSIKVLPDDLEEMVHPFDALRQKIGDGGLAPGLLALPLDLLAAPDELLDPQEEGGGDAGG